MRVIIFIDTQHTDHIYLHSNDVHAKIYITDSDIVQRLQQCTYNYFYRTLDPNLSQLEIPTKIRELTISNILNIINYYEKLPESDPIKLNIARLYHFIGYENYAEGIYKSLGQNSVAISNLGYIAYKKRDYGNAIQYYKQSLKMGNFETAGLIGSYYYTIKNYKKMKKYYRLAIDNGVVEYIVIFGNYYQNTKRYDLAEKYYLQAINYNSIPAIIAYCYLHIDELQLIECYIQQLKNINYPVYGILVSIAGKKGDKHDEIKYYIEGTTFGNVNYMIRLAYIHDQKGDSKTTKSYAKMAMCLNHVNGVTRMGIYNHNTNRAKALDYYRMGILLNDSNSAHNTGNHYFVTVKDYDLALEYYLLAEKYNNYSVHDEIFSMYKQIIYIYKSKSNPIFLDYYNKCTKLGYIPIIVNYVKYLYDTKNYSDMLFISRYAINLANKRKKNINGISDICNVLSQYYFEKKSYIKDLYYKLLSIKYDSYVTDADAKKSLAIRFFDQSSNYSVKTDLTKKINKCILSNKYAIIIKYLMTCYNLCKDKNIFTYEENPMTYAEDLFGLDPNGKYAPIRDSSIKRLTEYYSKRDDYYEFILKYERYLPDEIVKQLDYLTISY